MSDDDLHTYRKAPPDTDEDWQRLHRAMDRADRAWIVTGPAVAFAENWKAWVFAIGMFFLLLRINEIPELLEIITGARK